MACLPWFLRTALTFLAFLRASPSIVSPVPRKNHRGRLGYERNSSARLCEGAGTVDGFGFHPF